MKRFIDLVDESLHFNFQLLPCLIDRLTEQWLRFRGSSWYGPPSLLSCSFNQFSQLLCWPGKASGSGSYLGAVFGLDQVYLSNAAVFWKDAACCHIYHKQYLRMAGNYLLFFWKGFAGGVCQIQQMGNTHVQRTESFSQQNVYYVLCLRCFCWFPQYLGQPTSAGGKEPCTLHSLK